MLSLTNKLSCRNYYFYWFQLLFYCHICILFLLSCSHIAEHKPSNDKFQIDSKKVQYFLSWTELKNRNVVRQYFDYSCGAASLATILRYYFNENLSEMDIIRGVLEQLPKTEILDRRQKGFSLLDLKRTVISMGYQAIGVKIDLKTLASLNLPVIVHLDRGKMQHFVVFRGSVGNRVYLADPSWGNLTVTLNKFKSEWSKTALIITKKGHKKPIYHPLMIKDWGGISIEHVAARISFYNLKPGY